MLEGEARDVTMHDRLLDETERDTFGYMLVPWVFGVGDTCLFLPPESHREVWEGMSQFYSQPGVVLKRHRGITRATIDDEYDVLFNVDGTATAVTEIPGVYLQRLGQS